MSYKGLKKRVRQAMPMRAGLGSHHMRDNMPGSKSSDSAFHRNREEGGPWAWAYRSMHRADADSLQGVNKSRVYYENLTCGPNSLLETTRDFTIQPSAGRLQYIKPHIPKPYTMQWLCS